MLQVIFLVRMMVHHRDRFEITEDQQDQYQHSERSRVLVHAKPSSFHILDFYVDTALA